MRPTHRQLAGKRELPLPDQVFWAAGLILVVLAFGAESAAGEGVPLFEVVHNGAGPEAFVAVQPGDTYNFQCWYRDIGNTNNFTDGVSILFL